MSGQLPPLLLPVRVVGDVTNDIRRIAEQARIEQDRIDKKFGDDVRPRTLRGSYEQLLRERAKLHADEARKQKAARAEDERRQKAARAEDERRQRNEEKLFNQHKRDQARVVREQKQAEAAERRTMSVRLKGMNLANRAQERYERTRERSAEARRRAYVGQFGTGSEEALTKSIAAARKIEAFFERRAAKGIAGTPEHAKSLEGLNRYKAARMRFEEMLAARQKSAADKAAAAAERARRKVIADQRRADREADMTRARADRQRAAAARRAAAEERKRVAERARLFRSFNRAGGRAVGRVAGAAGGALVGAAGAATQIPQVAVGGARAFASYMRDAATHSKTVIGSLREFAGNLYLVERFGFMMNTAGRAVATPFAAAVRNSAMLEEQTMGIAVHLGAYAKDQNASFSELFLSAQRAATYMRDQAAKFPGEADDYIEIVRQTTSQQASVGVNDMKQLLDNSINTGIVAILNGIDVQQGGRDLARMLEGRASQRERLFNVLRPKMRGASGGQITAEEYNKLTGVQRAEKAFSAMKPYLRFVDEYEKTFGAQSGAFKSNVRIAAERGFKPFFEYLVGGMTKVNKWLTTNMDKIAAVGQSLSRKLVNLVSAIGGAARSWYKRSAAPYMAQIAGNVRAGALAASARRRVAFMGGSEYARDMGELLRGRASQRNRVFTHLGVRDSSGKRLSSAQFNALSVAQRAQLVTRAANRGGGTIAEHVSGAMAGGGPLTQRLGQILTPLTGFARAINGFTGALGVASGPLRVFGAAVSNFANTISLAVGFFEGLTGDTRQLSGVIQGARDLWGAMTKVGGQVADIFRKVGFYVGDIFAGLLEETMPHLTAAFEWFSGFLDQMKAGLGPFFTTMKPLVLDLASGFVKLVKGIWEYVEPSIRKFGEWFARDGSQLTDYIGDVISGLIEGLGYLAYAVMQAVNSIMGIVKTVGGIFGWGTTAAVERDAAAASEIARLINGGALPHCMQPAPAGRGATEARKMEWAKNRSLATSKLGADGQAVADVVIQAVNEANRAKAKGGQAAYQNSLIRSADVLRVKQKLMEDSSAVFRAEALNAALSFGENWDKHRAERRTSDNAWGKAKQWSIFGKKIKADVQEKGIIDTKLAGGGVTTPEKRGGNNFDFRGSRFTIEQKFDPDFDPDRIAVAMTEQIGVLATRKTTSTLAPLSWQF